MLVEFTSTVDAVTCAVAVQNLIARETFMKFYDCAAAPSPRRVRIFLAEKGLTVPPTVQVDLRNGEQFTPSFRALNPDCTVPVLELDSGAAITDIIAICRYFEELHPNLPLMGRSAEERAVIESWLRRIEWDGIYAAQEAFRNATPGLKGRALPGPVNLEQIPALAERGRLRLQHFFAWLDARLADNEFVSGPHFTMADISGLVAVDLSTRAKLRPPEYLSVAPGRCGLLSRPSSRLEG